MSSFQNLVQSFGIYRLDPDSHRVILNLMSRSLEKNDRVMLNFVLVLYLI
jgi:hypothetical protein